MEAFSHARAERTLLPFFPRLIYLRTRELGYSDVQLFDQLDLSAEQLHDENYRLSVEQHERFILRVLSLTGDPHFALRLAQRQESATANVALLAVAQSGRISKALHMIMRYNKIFTRVFSIRSLDVSDHSAMVLDVHLDHEHVIYFAVGSFALFLDRFFRDVLGDAPLVRSLELAIPEPSDFDSVRDDYPFVVTFNSPAYRIEFDARQLDRPMQQGDPQTVRLLVEMSERQLAEANAEMGLEGALKALLISQISSPPKLDDAARILGISPRGLRRKLAESGTTYQKTLDAMRLQMATRLLRETDSRVSSIAYELGFDNASDFARAFKKWSGQSPSGFRSS